MGTIDDMYIMGMLVDIVSPRNFSTRQSVYRETKKKKILYEHNNNQNTL